MCILVRVKPVAHHFLPFGKVLYLCANRQREWGAKDKADMRIDLIVAWHKMR